MIFRASIARKLGCFGIFSFPLYAIIGYSLCQLERPSSLGMAILLGRNTKKHGWQPFLLNFGLFDVKGTASRMTTKSSQLKG